VACGKVIFWHLYAELKPITKTVVGTWLPSRDSNRNPTNTKQNASHQTVNIDIFSETA
jgi:hypothetical protein